MRSSLNPTACLLLTTLFGGVLLPAQLAVPPACPSRGSSTSQWSTNTSDELTFDALTPFTLNSVSIIVRPNSATLPISGAVSAHVPAIELQQRRAVLDSAVHEARTLCQNRLSFALNRMRQGVGILSI